LAFINHKKRGSQIGRPFQRFRITTVVSYDTGCRLPVRFRLLQFNAQLRTISCC